MDLERVTVLSPSALERYRLCPRLYRFLYVDGPGGCPAPAPSRPSGPACTPPCASSTVPVGRRSLRMLLELFKRGWVRDGYRDKEQQQQEKERGAEALRAWYGRADTTVVPHATELGLQAVWGDVVLKGRLDRVDADGGAGRGLVVVDYKTGRRPVTQETADADEALTIYAALVERRLGRPVTRLVLDYVVAGTQVVTERPPEVLARRLARCWPPRSPSAPTRSSGRAPGPGAPAATCSSGAPRAMRWPARTAQLD